jgi:hypothetical protein
LRLLNVAVKERFETTRFRVLKLTPLIYKGCSLVVRPESVPSQSHGGPRRKRIRAQKRALSVFFAFYVAPWEKGKIGNIEIESRWKPSNTGI